MLITRPHDRKLTELYNMISGAAGAGACEEGPTVFGDERLLWDWYENARRVVHVQLGQVQTIEHDHVVQ